MLAPMVPMVIPMVVPRVHGQPIPFFMSFPWTRRYIHILASEPGLSSPRAALGQHHMAGLLFSGGLGSNSGAWFQREREREIYIYIHIYIYLCVCARVCVGIRILHTHSKHMCHGFDIYLFIYLSIYLTIYLSIYPSIYLSIYL